MKSWLRWTANALAIFLALYLLDTVARGRFQLTAAWVALILALLLGLLGSFVRPLRRARSKPFIALIATVLTVLINALILQLFIWAGAALTVTSFVWILVAAAFVSVLTGVINWLVGFKSKEKARPSGRERTTTRRPDKQATRAPRART
ncbi:MAG: phage holin family protein [bacterium]